MEWKQVARPAEEGRKGKKDREEWVEEDRRKRGRATLPLLT